mmetsp:Transcript_120252/g.351406  ORF Transcript_120252/g.351406 Transcript_120252/m.351406 type:complete len:294 (+) Transcript_120252:513-1394(+)
MDEVVNQLLLLLQPVGDVDLFLLLAAQGQEDVIKKPLLVVLIKLRLVAVLRAVAGAEEKSHRSTLLAVCLGCSPLLNEGTHGCDSGAQRHHHKGSFVGFRHGHSRWVDATVNPKTGGIRLLLTQPASCEAHTIPPTLRSPLILDDAQVSLILTTQTRGGGDGIQARFDVRDIVQQIADAWLCTGELLKQFSVCEAFLNTLLVIGFAFPAAQVAQLLLLGRVGGAELQHLVKTALGPASNVQDLREEHTSCDDLWQGNRAVRVNWLQVQDLVALQTQGCQAHVDLILGTGRPNT